MFFDHYPYTNFHNVNLDWVLQAVKAWGQTVKANDQAFKDLKEANESFKAYVRNYLQDLDVSDEINTKLDRMLADGTLIPYFAPYVKGYVESWLASNVTPTTPALDKTLSLDDAAANAAATGERIESAAYLRTLDGPKLCNLLNKNLIIPDYRIQSACNAGGYFYVCGGSKAADGKGFIAKMSSLDFKDAEITYYTDLGHANDITYSYTTNHLYVTTVGEGVEWGIWNINPDDLTDKTLITNCPENTIGIQYVDGWVYVLAPPRIYRTLDFETYTLVINNTNEILNKFSIQSDGRISQTLVRLPNNVVGWVGSYIKEPEHIWYGFIAYFGSHGAITFDVFPTYNAECQAAIWDGKSTVYVISNGTTGPAYTVLRMDCGDLKYLELGAGKDLNDYTGEGLFYLIGAATMNNCPVNNEGLTLKVSRQGLLNTRQDIYTNSGRHLYRIKLFNAGTWGEWVEQAAEIAQIKEDLIHNSETLNTEDGFSTYPITRKARLNTDGSVVPSTAFVTTDFIPLKNGTYKVINKNFNVGFTIYRCTYDSQKKLIEYTTFIQDTAERMYFVPDTNVAFIRYSVSETVYNGGISFKLVENLKDDVNIIRRNVYGNLCGDNPDEFYPVVLSEGDYITLSTSTGDVPPSPIELIFFDANYYRIGAYTLNAKRRSIKIDQKFAATKYIKWGKKPDVPMQVELGGAYTDYKEYRPNIFTCAQLLDESKNVYTYAPLPIVAVMSYNVGEWYDGTRHEMPESEYSLYENIQKTILRKNYASIFCAQEYYHTMYAKALDAKNMFLYPLYKHVSTLDDVALSRGKAIATNLWIESVESVDFVNQSGIASKYQKAYLFINGHKVCVCNVHLSNIDTQQALLEAQEIATAMANEEYFIVMGDFNVSFASATGADVISAFEAIGAKPCNCGAFGQFDTARGSTSIGTTDRPIDNIFVSSNIKIKSVYIDTTKIDAELPIQDHVPLVAYLEIF